MEKKAQITGQTIFYILMGILFVSILIFGFQKIFSLQNTLDDQERLEIKNYMRDSFEYCEDPLNAGNFKTFEIENNGFNIICLLGEDVYEKYPDYIDFLTLYNTSQNVVIMNTDWTEDENGDYQFDNTDNIIDSIKLDSVISKTQCFVKDSGKNLIEVKIRCD